jgi:hypothetical protein
VKDYDDQRRYEIARAAAQDAANRQMKEGRRARWSLEDYCLAVETMDKLYGYPDE